MDSVIPPEAPAAPVVNIKNKEKNSDSLNKNTVDEESKEDNSSAVCSLAEKLSSNASLSNIEKSSKNKRYLACLMCGENVKTSEFGKCCSNECKQFQDATNRLGYRVIAERDMETGKVNRTLKDAAKKKFNVMNSVSTYNRTSAMQKKNNILNSNLKRDIQTKNKHIPSNETKNKVSCVNDKGEKEVSINSIPLLKQDKCPMLSQSNIPLMRQNKCPYGEEDFEAYNDAIKKEGFLKKRALKSGKNWKKRYFILEEKQLFYYIKKGDKNPKGSVKLSSSSAVVEDYQKLGLEVTNINNSDSSLFLCASTHTEVKEWAEAIRSHIS